MIKEDLEETAHEIEAEIVGFFGVNRFFVMIILSIIISGALVFTGMTLYKSSGAAQLDMSRPGYQDVRDQIDDNDGVETYPSVGEINQQVIDDFINDFTKEQGKIESVDAYGGDPLDPVALGLSE